MKRKRAPVQPAKMFKATLTIEGKKNPSITPCYEDKERTLFHHSASPTGVLDFVECIRGTKELAEEAALAWRKTWPA